MKIFSFKKRKIYKNKPMQNLPNELIVEISKSLPLAELQSLASTCKDYYYIFYKDIKDLHTIMKALKRYYIKVIVSANYCTEEYSFYVYNTKYSIDTCCSKNTVDANLLHKYVDHIKPHVFMKVYKYKFNKEEFVECKVIDIKIF
jgi:hypothetical protein